MSRQEPGAVYEPGELFRPAATRPIRGPWRIVLSEPGYAACVAGILLFGIALRIAATLPVAMHHPDEIIQYLEQAHRLVFGYGVVPWEYRYGMRQWLVPLLLSEPMRLGNAIAPGSDLYLLLPRMTVALLSCAIMVAAWRLGNRISRLHGLVALFVASIWFELVYFAAHTLTEPLAAATFLSAAAVLLRRQPLSARALFAGGTLLGLTAILRFHYLPAIAVLALAVGQWEMRDRWRPLAGGGLAAMACAGLIDLAMGAAPFSWIVENFRMNIIDNRAAEFGVSGPFAYVENIFSQWWLAAIPLVLLAAGGARRYPALFWAAMINLAVHMLIGHKEYRFIFLTVSIFIILAALGSVDLLERLRKASPRMRESLVMTPIALLAGWALLSASLAVSKPMIDRWSGYRGPLIAMKTVGLDSHSCAIALYRGIAWVAGYTYLHRPIPIYLPGVLSPDSTPATQLAAASPAYNAILATPMSATEMPRGYRFKGCFGRSSGVRHDGALCLFQRAGGCDPSAGESLGIQKILLLRDR